MLKKLSEEKQQKIIDCAVHEFADRGLKDAKLSSIAKAAGISVGVLYKYYEDKNALFLSCVRYVTGKLEEFLEELLSHEDKPLNYARALIYELQKYSRRHGEYIRLYHVTTCTCDYAREMAREIEGITSQVYVRFIAQAQQKGLVRGDLDPGLFAFFLDSLLTVTQFSYSCPYYTERMKLYAGQDILDRDEYVAEQLLRFLESAFTLEQKDIVHSSIS